MTRTEIQGDGYALTIDLEIIEYRTQGHHELARDWKHTDPSGHTHVSLETLERVVTGTYWCEECRDEHEESEYRCRACGAVVEPEYRWVDESHETKRLPGLTDIRLVLADGRGYRVRPDEQPVTFDAHGALTNEWIERVASRDPDWLDQPKEETWTDR